MIPAKIADSLLSLSLKYDGNVLILYLIIFGAKNIAYMIAAK